MDDGDTVALTLRKEFAEEALNSMGSDTSAVDHLLRDLFSNGTFVRSQYSEDPRNTDNAWIETTVLNFHDPEGHGVGKFNLHAGDDADRVRWMMVHRDLRLFASHRSFLKTVADRLDAYW